MLFFFYGYKLHTTIGIPNYKLLGFGVKTLASREKVDNYKLTSPAKNKGPGARAGHFPSFFLVKMVHFLVKMA